MPELNAVLEKITEIAPGLAIFKIRPEGWELPEFTPGQFAVLGLPGSAKRCVQCDQEEVAPPADKLIRRAYSIASSSHSREELELYITLIRSGELTPRLFALEEGDKLFLSQKMAGSFTMDKAGDESNIILMSTGTGIAPYMSMIRSLFSGGSRRRFVVIHGARHSWDLGYRAELATLSFYNRNFYYIPVISRPDEEKTGWAGYDGYIQNVWSRRVIGSVAGVTPNPANSHIFLCGNPAMTDIMVKLLANEGFEEDEKGKPGTVHLERYW